MPYIKIEDPNIIDLAAWHQVINVVNQHSDNLAALTNNFGLGWNPDTNSDGSWDTVYDLGTQTIQYGRTRMNGSVENEVEFGTTPNIKYVYEETITFPNGFSANPNVVATASRSTSDSATVTDFNVSISNITATTFKARVVNKDQSQLSDSISWYVNWIAIGPQV